MLTLYEYKYVYSILYIPYSTCYGTTCYVVTKAKRRLSDTTAWSSRIHVLGNMLTFDNNSSIALIFPISEHYIATPPDISFWPFLTR